MVGLPHTHMTSVFMYCGGQLTVQIYTFEAGKERDNLQNGGNLMMFQINVFKCPNEIENVSPDVRTLSTATYDRPSNTTTLGCPPLNNRAINKDSRYASYCKGRFWLPSHRLCQTTLPCLLSLFCLNY